MTPQPALEAVVCDAGGTLVRLDFEWMADDLAAHGLRGTAAALRRAEVQGRRAYDASARPGSPDAPAAGRDVRAYFSGMLAAAGMPEAGIASAVERLLARQRASGLWCRPMEGAREALDGLRAAGLRLAVVSNSDGRAEHHLARAGMLEGIEFVVDSHRVGIEKPDPAIFAVALERLGVAPGRALFVGDIRSVDEEGARSAGMHFVLLDPFGDYGAPEVPRIEGMHALVGWVTRAFRVAGARGPGAFREGSAPPRAPGSEDVRGSASRGSRPR